MGANNTLEQHIAVLGESGSGKTVLVSSFYGATQEPQFLKKSAYTITADNVGQGNRLHRNYLGMRDSGELPEPTRFQDVSYTFSLKLKTPGGNRVSKSGPVDAARLVWHDYPGEWFEQDASGPEEEERRIQTFRSLLTSDVALILVDAQRLKDNAGEEERYLKSLFTNFRNGLLTLREQLLQGEQRYVRFPRIWILALSKSDLLPDVDVFHFRDLLISKTTGEIEELRETIASFTTAPGALSIGEDFALLSSAKFEPGQISVDERIGLDLVLPIASILPFQRHVRWANAKQLPGKAGEQLLRKARHLAPLILGRRNKLPGPLGKILRVIDVDILTEAAELAGDKLRDLNTRARTEHELLQAILTGFKQDLEQGEEMKIFLRSLK